MKNIEFFFIKIIISMSFIVLSTFAVTEIIKNMEKDLIENSKNAQIEAQTNLAKFKREAAEKEKQRIQQEIQKQARLEAQRQAAEEQARKQKLKQAREKIAQERAEEKKAADFEAQYQAPEGCNNPDAKWSKFVECKNHKITAKENFYKTH